MHIQHLTCLSTDLILECAARRIPTVFTLNDYWLICHRGQLFDLDYERCDGPYPNGCARCIGAAGAAGPRSYRLAGFLRKIERRLPRGAAGALGRAAAAGQRTGSRLADSRAASAARLEHMRRMSAAVTQFLAPSNTLRERFLEFGLPAERIVYAPQGIDQSGFAGLQRTSSSHLRFAFMGSLLVSKAPHILIEAFVGLPRGAATLDVFGSFAPYHGDDRYRAQVEPLLSQPDVRVRGPIPHEAVPAALASIDVSWCRRSGSRTRRSSSARRSPPASRSSRRTSGAWRRWWSTAGRACSSAPATRRISGARCCG